MIDEPDFEALAREMSDNIWAGDDISITRLAKELRKVWEAGYEAGRPKRRKGATPPVGVR